MKKLFSLILCVASSVSFGATQLIAHLAPGTVPSTVASKYHITLLDQSYANSAFALFGLASNQEDVTIQKLMLGDPQILWVEDNEDLGSPEALSKTRAGIVLKGSTIAAVGDDNVLYAENKDLLTQIKWNSSYSLRAGRLVRIAVLDTGISPKQPLLLKAMVASVNLVEAGQTATDLPRGEDTDGDGIPDESTGHGTMVAGIISQMAPKAQLVVVRIADSDGDTNAWRIIKGISFAVQNRCEVANLSMGSRSRIAALSDVMDWAESNNLLVCAPVGNDDLVNADFPAEIHNTLSVSGVDPRDAKATFSNWDSATISAAPATGVKSFWWDGTLGIWSGTSFASPFVAGVIADALRQVAKPMQPGLLRRLAASSGDSIDKVNLQFKKELGTRLNVGALENAIISGSGSGSGPIHV